MRNGGWHDEGYEWPESIALHPRCDAGTGLMLYWMNSPEFHYGNATSITKLTKELTYLKTIELYYLNKSYRTSNVKFDPEIALSKRNSDTYRWIPIGMLCPSPSRKVSEIKWQRDDQYNIML